MARHALWASAVLLAALAVPAAGQEVQLKWKFKQGDKFYVEDVTVMKQSVAVLNQVIKEEQKTTTVTSYQIEKVGTEGITVKMKIEGMDVKSDSPIGLYAKIMEKTKGASFTFTLTPEGKVTKLEGFDEFLKKLDTGDEDTNKMLKLFITEDMYMQSIEQAFGFVPNKAVKKGDSWTRENKIPFSGMGEFKSSTIFTYNGKGEGGEQITLKQELAYVPPKKGADFGGLFKVLKGDLKAENAKGTYVFDAEKGRLVSANNSMVIRGTLTLDLNGMEVTVDIRAEQTGTSRVLDKSPLIDS